MSDFHRLHCLGGALRSITCAFVLIASLTVAPAAQDVTTPDGWTQERIGLLSLEGPPETERAVRALAAHAREILPQLESELGLRPARRFQIVLVPRGGLDDADLARIDQAAPPWAAGYLIPERRIGAIRIAQAARYPYGTLESTLAHEATHMLLHDAVGRRLPLWFEEGVATWQGRQWSAEDMWVYTRSLLTTDLPALAGLDTAFHASAGEAELAYAASFAFVSWNVRKHGATLVRDVLREVKSRPFAAAWEAVTHVSLRDAEAAWRRESLIRYRWIPLLTASSTLWLLVALFVVWAGFRKRARARAIRERWEAEEKESAL